MGVGTSELLRRLHDDDCVASLSAALLSARAALNPSCALRRLVATPPSAYPMPTVQLLVRKSRASAKAISEALEKLREAHRSPEKLISGTPTSSSWEWCRGGLLALEAKGGIGGDDIPARVASAVAASHESTRRSLVARACKLIDDAFADTSVAHLHGHQAHHRVRNPKAYVQNATSEPQTPPQLQADPEMPREAILAQIFSDGDVSSTRGEGGASTDGTKRRGRRHHRHRRRRHGAGDATADEAAGGGAGGGGAGGGGAGGGGAGGGGEQERRRSGHERLVGGQACGVEGAPSTGGGAGESRRRRSSSKAEVTSWKGLRVMIRATSEIAAGSGDALQKLLCKQLASEVVLRAEEQVEALRVAREAKAHRRLHQVGPRARARASEGADPYGHARRSSAQAAQGHRGDRPSSPHG